MVHVLGPPTLTSVGLGFAILSGQTWVIAFCGIALGFTIGMSVVIFRMR